MSCELDLPKLWFMAYDNTGTRNTVALITGVTVVMITLLVIVVTVLVILMVVAIILRRQHKSVLHLNDDHCMEHNSHELTSLYIPVDDKHFQILNVTQDCELREFVEKRHKLLFTRGCAFYEFTHDVESILDHEEVVLMDKVRE